MNRAALIMASRDASFAERQRKLAAELHARMRALLLARKREIHHADPELAIEFVLEQLRGTLMARLDARPLDATLFAASDEQFIAEALEEIEAVTQAEPENLGYRAHLGGMHDKMAMVASRLRDAEGVARHVASVG